MIQADTAASLMEQIEIPMASLDWRAYVNLPLLINTGLRILVVFLLAWLAYRGLALLLRRLERSIEDGEPAAALQEQRAKTLLSLVRSIGVAFIGIMILFMFLGAIGVQIAPLLAGAGVLGLAISFGAQSLVRDVMSGLFFLGGGRAAGGGWRSPIGDERDSARRGRRAAAGRRDGGAGAMARARGEAQRAARHDAWRRRRRRDVAVKLARRGPTWAATRATAAVARRRRREHLERR